MVPRGDRRSHDVARVLVFVFLTTTAPVVGLATVAGGAGAPAAPEPGTLPADSTTGSGGAVVDNETGPPPVVGDHAPADPNGDGVYEDVNGDGVVGVTDADALLKHRNDSAVDSVPDRYDFDGDGRVTRADASRLFRAVTVGIYEDDADADRLPDAYEREIGTDPRDGDSNASATATDESDDGRMDGREDFDGDGLETSDERTAGTDPFVADSDGDGLGDGYEARVSGIDPALADTDGDGIPDGNEDDDGDGLVTAVERTAGTLPSVSDTDGDGLDDGTERAGPTDPTVADTDGDGLADGAERDAGTDPTLADTDGDGTLDANETLTTTVESSETGASVAFTGEGNVAGGAALLNETGDSPADPGSGMAVGPTVQVANTREFRNATVRLPYDESAVDPSNATVVRYDSERQWFVPVNTTVDRANGTAVATVGHFSEVSVFDRSVLEEVRRTTTRALPTISEDFEDGSAPRLASDEGTVETVGQTGNRSLVYGDAVAQGLFTVNLSRNFTFRTLVRPKGTAEFAFDLDTAARPRVDVRLDGGETELTVGENTTEEVLDPDDPLVTSSNRWNWLVVDARGGADGTTVRVQRWQAGRDRPDGWDLRVESDSVGKAIAGNGSNQIRIVSPADDTLAIDEYSLQFDSPGPPREGEANTSPPGIQKVDEGFEDGLPDGIADEDHAELVAEGFRGEQSLRVTESIDSPGPVDDAALFNRQFNVTALVKSPAGREAATDSLFDIGIGGEVTIGVDSDPQRIEVRTPAGTRTLNRSVGGTWYWYQFGLDYRNGGPVYLFRRWEAGTSRPSGWDVRLRATRGEVRGFVGGFSTDVEFEADTQPLLVDQYRIDSDEAVEPGLETDFQTVRHEDFEDGDAQSLVDDETVTDVVEGEVGEKALEIPFDSGEFTVGLSREFRIRALLWPTLTDGCTRPTTFSLSVSDPSTGDQNLIRVTPEPRRSEWIQPRGFAHVGSIREPFSMSFDRTVGRHWVEIRGDLVNGTFVLFVRTWHPGFPRPSEYQYRVRPDRDGRQLATGNARVEIYGSCGVAVDQYTVETVREGPVDADGDGYSNRQERAGFPVSPDIARRIYNPGNDTDSMDATGIEQWVDPGNFVDEIGELSLPRLRTDPFDPDTDGDGIDDGEELGEKGSFGDVTYYTLNSDPTDDNTDDVGLDDAEERAIDGSNPLRQERLTVTLQYPVKGQEKTRNGETVYVPELERNRKVVGVTAVERVPTGSSDCPDPAPDEKWLRGVGIECGKMYLKIPVWVSASVDRPSGEAVEPRFVDFATGGGGGVEGRLIAAENPDLGFDRTRSYVVLEVGNSPYPTGELGQIHAEVVVPEESIFVRSDDRSVEGGTDRVVTLGGDSLRFDASLRVSAEQLRERTAQKLYDGYMSAWSVYSSVYGIGMAVTRGSSSLFRATMDDIANNGIKRFGKGLPITSKIADIVPASCVASKAGDVALVIRDADTLFSPRGENRKCALDIAKASMKAYITERGGVETEATLEDRKMEVAGDIYVFRTVTLVREN